MQTPETIEVQGLACTRGERLVFADVAFQLAKGAVLAVEGPNGAGKTSLLRILAGFIEPSAGSVCLVSGRERVREAEERAKLVGWLGHADAARSQLTPLELLRDFSALYRSAVDVHAALDRVGLATLASLPCRYLSAGQKKRLALARLLVCNRSIWLLDEPLAALDTRGKALASNLIQEHSAAGGIAVVATHEPLNLESFELRLGGQIP